MYTDLQSENIICLFLCKSLLKIIYKHSFENQGCAAFKNEKKKHPLIHTQTHTHTHKLFRSWYTSTSSVFPAYLQIL